MDATHGRRGQLRVVPEVAHTDFTPTATVRQDAQDSPDARDPQRSGGFEGSKGSEGGHDFTGVGHAAAAAQRYADANGLGYSQSQDSDQTEGADDQQA